MLRCVIARSQRVWTHASSRPILHRGQHPLPTKHAQLQVRSFGKANKGMSQMEKELLFIAFRFIARNLGRATRYMVENMQQLSPRQVKLFAVALGVPLSALGLFAFSHIETVPYIDRLHIRWLDDDEEGSLSRGAYQELLRKEAQYFLDEKDPLFLATKRIVDGLLNVCIEDRVVSKDSSFSFKLHIIKSSVANAFVLPDGSIFVYTGILPVAKNEAGLACVIGHELSHALAHHSSEKIGILRFLMLLYEFVDGFVEDPYSPRGSSFTRFLLGTLFQIGIPLAYSRQMETEADRMGLRIAARAGFDPREGKEVWKRMMAAEHAPKKQQGSSKDGNKVGNGNGDDEKTGSRELPISHVHSVQQLSAASIADISKNNDNKASTAHSLDNKTVISTTANTAPAAKSSASPTTVSQPPKSNPSTNTSIKVTTVATPAAKQTPPIGQRSTAGTIQRLSDDDDITTFGGAEEEGSADIAVPKITWRGRVRELLSTHPCHERRIQDLDAYAQLCMDDFHSKVDNLRQRALPPPNSYRTLLKKKEHTEAVINSVSPANEKQNKPKGDPIPAPPTTNVQEKKKQSDDEVEFDEYDYGFDPPKETEQEYFQRLQLAQQCSALMVGPEADEIQSFLHKVGCDKQLWGHQH